MCGAPGKHPLQHRIRQQAVVPQPEEVVCALALCRCHRGLAAGKKTYILIGEKKIQIKNPMLRDSLIILDFLALIAGCISFAAIGKDIIKAYVLEQFFNLVVFSVGALFVEHLLDLVCTARALSTKVCKLVTKTGDSVITFPVAEGGSS